MAISLGDLSNETIMRNQDSSEVRYGRFRISEYIVPADMMQRPERLDYSRIPARRPYTAAAEPIAPGTWLITIKWDCSLLNLKAGESIRVQDDLCTLALARAFKELRVRFPTCKHVYGCVDLYEMVDVYSSEQQQQQPSSEDDAPSPSPQDGAMTLKSWVVDPSQIPVDVDEDEDDTTEDGYKYLEAWLSVVPRNDYDAKELEWCSSHEPREDEATRMGRPLVSSVSQGDGPDGYSPLLVLGSCRLCGKDHEPYPGDVSQAAQAAADD
ncbi:uncharacterized protein BO72DRAFT_489301 [Aspergillus fijiensis CBS 313.89]|uniref:Uncharacterized protein n=1 Tax=Aspergillus fijiensis CBS 313.89 TaxID=1448319 RepID=A0A8G1RII2_9EURO|nr:uncharacterized protein BO72DRAFT_489301 [Aspergillus fijiensis CBS 313.89]RAK73017.1 hypothetical protein BO72DRAFT_489301 [Aspergillus fijiensis CBS 313.89]